MKILLTGAASNSRKEFFAASGGRRIATYADMGELMRDVDFKPITSIEAGVTRFVEWYRTYYQI